MCSEIRACLAGSYMGAHRLGSVLQVYANSAEIMLQLRWTTRSLRVCGRAQCSVLLSCGHAYTHAH